MKSELTHAKQRLQELKHACINCHPTMKAYYQGEYEKWDLYVKQLSK